MAKTKKKKYVLQYWCSKCEKYHQKDSKIGKAHWKHNPYKHTRIQYK